MPHMRATSFAKASGDLSGQRVGQTHQDLASLDARSPCVRVKILGVRLRAQESGTSGTGSKGARLRDRLRNRRIRQRHVAGTHPQHRRAPESPATSCSTSRLRSLSAEQVAHQALLMTKWTEQFKLRAPSSNADTVAATIVPTALSPATDELRAQQWQPLPHHLWPPKAPTPDQQRTPCASPDGTLVLGPNIDRALAYIKHTMHQLASGTKVDTVMGTSVRQQARQRTRRYTRTDLGYDLVNHYLVAAQFLLTARRRR